DLNVVDNPQFRGLGPARLAWMFTTLHGGHYQPLTWMTLGLDYVLWGLDPRGYHLTSLVLHAANALLAWLLFRRLVRAAGGDSGSSTVLGAALGALLFAVHPLRVESVAWVSERRDVLSGFFWLATLLAYLRAQEEDGRTWRAVALGCLALSLLSKAWGMR